jgi:hypothetical protein
MIQAWNSESLAETVWALKRLLRLVPETGSATLSPTADGYRNQVKSWIRTVEPTLNEQQESEQAINVPPFPLKGSELESLEEEIHRLLTERVARTSGRKQVRARAAWKSALSLDASLEHLHVTLRQAGESSWFIIEVVGILFGLDTICLLALIALRHTIPLSTSLVALALAGNLLFLALVAWLWLRHHGRLEQHREGLQWHVIHHGL